MLQITNKQDCCGCYACVQRCPKQCIRMESDEEGFEYPIIDKEQCINCGLCNKVCPQTNTSYSKQPINIYIKCCPNVYLLTVVKRCLKRMAFLFHKDLDILTLKSGKRYI